MTAIPIKLDPREAKRRLQAMLDRYVDVMSRGRNMDAWANKKALEMAIEAFDKEHGLGKPQEPPAAEG